MKFNTLTQSLLLTSAFALAIVPVSSYALPTGGTVTSGTATISNTVGQTTINQTSNKAIINWTGFDTLSAEKVQFNQPSQNAIALNKINSNTSTNFQGQLTANGRVWVINTNGMLFGSTAKVNVGGLLATTSTISDSDFNAGNNNFTPGGHPFANVTNDGTINSISTATLVAPNVSNTGRISTKSGNINLAGADKFSIDLLGDGLVTLSPNSNIGVQETINNTGTLNAPNAGVYLSTAQTNSALDNSINLAGFVTAANVDVTANSGSAGVDATYNSGELLSRSGNNFKVSAAHNVWVGSNAKIGDGARKINVTLGANKDNTNNGYIYMIDGASIKSGGGKVVLGGGSDPTSGFAYGSGNSFSDSHGNNVDASGVTLGDVTIDAAGGDISIRGTGYSPINPSALVNSNGVQGISYTSTGVIKTNGAGKISINGVGGSSNMGNSTGVQMLGYTLATDAGDLVINGRGGNASNTSGVFLSTNNISTGAGRLALTGYTGVNNSLTGNNIGLYVANGTLTSGAGALNLYGDATQSYSDSNFGNFGSIGISFDHTTVSSTGTGSGLQNTIVGLTGLKGAGIKTSYADFNTIDRNMNFVAGYYNGGTGVSYTGTGPSSFNTTGLGRYSFSTLVTSFNK